MPETDFDPIAAAEAALESGARSREAAQRFARHAIENGRLAELASLLSSFDSWHGRSALLDWLVEGVDDGRLVWKA